MAAGVSGWCPIHDRTFESDDGLCPKCGTALVSDEAPKPSEVIVIDADVDDEPRVEDELAPILPKRKALLGIATAVVIAFVAGLAFPRGNQTTSAPKAPHQVVADLNVGLTRPHLGIRLRLESFTQRGRNIVARFTVPDEVQLDLGSLEGIEVFLTLAGGGEVSDNVAPRTTTTGFVIAGSFLQRDDVPVTGVRIDALQFHVGSGRRVDLDVSDAWPVARGDEPRAARAALRVEPGDGRIFTLSGLVGWRGSLELHFSVEGQKYGHVYDTSWHLGPSEGSESDYASVNPEDQTVAVRFADLPTGEKKFKLSVRVTSVTAIGPWEWSFI